MIFPHNNITTLKSISKTWKRKYVELIKSVLCDNEQMKFVRRWFKKRVDFRNRIKQNHLKLEPLCCLQSCLIREGCLSVAVIEAIFVVISSLCLFFNYRNNELNFEIRKNETFDINDLQNFKNINETFFILYKIFIIIMILYNIVSILFLAELLIGLYTFSKKHIRYFTYFSYFTIIFIGIFYFFLILVLIIKEKSHWDGGKIFLFIIIIFRFLLHLWSISVTQTCSQFFNLIKVFVKMAEKSYP